MTAEVPGELAVGDVKIGTIGPNDVLIRTAAAGLCHSDLHVIEGVDRSPARLSLAQRLGATDVLSAAAVTDPVAAVPPAGLSA